jgi:hypothetical protein
MQNNSQIKNISKFKTFIQTLIIHSAIEGENGFKTYLECKSSQLIASYRHNDAV